MIENQKTDKKGQAKVERVETGPASKQAGGEAGEAVKNKKSGSDDRVGSVKAHEQGSLHMSIDDQAHPGAHRSAVGDTGVQSIQELGAIIQ